MVDDINNKIYKNCAKLGTTYGYIRTLLKSLEIMNINNNFKLEDTHELYQQVEQIIFEFKEYNRILVDIIDVLDYNKIILGINNNPKDDKDDEGKS